MNKKLIYTGIWLCLGGLGLTNSAWADSDSANKQSVKKCWFGVEDADVVLTKEQPYGHVNDNVTSDDPTDDFYEICADDTLTGCTLHVDVVTSDSGNGIVEFPPVLDPVSGEHLKDSGDNLLYYPGLKIYGSSNSDVIYGTQGGDEACGNGGNDYVYGEGGDDNLQGNNGNDVVVGGPGNDEVYGGNGSDWLYGYDQDASNDLDGVADSNGDFVITDADILDDEDLLESGNGTDALFGGPNHDVMSGGNGNDALNGDGGNDELDGGNGKDALNGGEDVDAISFGKGKDSCTDNDSDLINDCPASQPKGKNGGKNGGNKGGKK